MTDRRTKIVATLGPASNTPESLRALVSAGIDAVRLNLSHGTHKDHAKSAWLVREIAAEVGRPVALIADLQGPKLRIGELLEPIVLTKGEQITVSAEASAKDGELPVAPAVIGEVLEPGHDVLIDDGLVRLRVESVEGGRASCAVLVGGLISSHKGVNLPGVPLPIPSLTPKDTQDLQFALETGVDFVALSFVRSPKDVHDLRTLIEQSGLHAQVIAKIEKAEAVDVLDDVLEAADAVMVARGDLGVEIGAALVPLLQKRIILKALERGKPVITATQMLESMIHSAEPTRAEASDVANAILDGTSAVMLSGETAVGEYPVESVAYMDRIARAVEPSMDYRHELGLGDAPARARVGRDAAAHQGVHRRRGAVDGVDLRGARRRPHRVGRPRRHHCRDRREHPGLDERHQGRHRLKGHVPVPGTGTCPGTRLQDVSVRARRSRGCPSRVAVSRVRSFFAAGLPSARSSSSRCSTTARCARTSMRAGSWGSGRPSSIVSSGRRRHSSNG